MPASSTDPHGVHRQRLFAGICLALIPTGASFALVSNILVPLKQEFILTNYQVGLIGGAALWGMAISLLVMGPLLEGFGLKNGARMAFAGHLIGITLMIAASTRAGDPAAFWMLMGGAATLAAGNGMIEVTGNPLVAALYPESKTTHLNLFHAFFPIGIVLGGVVGFLLATYGGSFGRWPYQLGVIYLPILVYGSMVLPQRFPKTENAEVGIPVREMFRYTLTHPLFLLMLAMMAITTSMELGPMRWVPAVLQAAGLHGILVLVWISGWMVVLRLLASHFVERLAPSGMLVVAATLTGSGLFLLSFATGTWSAVAAATVFAWGVAFFFPTMVGSVSERMPKTGSLGIVLTAGVGLGMAGAVGVPSMGKLADRYLAQALPAETLAVLQRVEQRFPDHLERATAATSLASLGYRPREVEDALAATRIALSRQRESGTLTSDATANALRAVVATAIPNEPLVAEASAILQPAEALGGQRAFRYVAPGALILLVVFGALYARDRRQGGYRPVKLERAAIALLVAGATLASGAAAQPAPPSTRQVASRADRMQVLLLGDNGHHQPIRRAQELLPVLARDGIDLFYTADPSDLNRDELARYDALVLYNNHAAVSRPQLNAVLEFVSGGHGLVVLHCASASFQNSEEFVRLVGGAFKSHGAGTITAVRVAGDHPAIRGVPTFESWDETYIHAKHNPVDRTVLEVRREGSHEEPWTWVRRYGRGRVFYTAWGHDERTWSNPGFQQLVERGIRWSAGDRFLTAPAPSPALQTTELDVPLPTYKRPPAPWNTLDTAITRAQVGLPTPTSLQLMTLRPRFRVEPFAHEPLIGNIVDFTWDARGRMWAVETNDYPNNVLPDTVPGNDRILILEDTSGDGRADKTTVFATGLNLATSLVFANGGLIVGQAPHMLFLRDTDGDDKADQRRILFSGWSRTDTHASISNLRYGFDNQIWGSVGYNGFRGTVGPSTYGRGDFGSGYFRFPPDGSNLEYLARTSNNTWGLGFTEDGFAFGSTANSWPSTFVHIPLRYYRALGARDPILPSIADRVDIFPLIDVMQVDQFGKYTSGAAHEVYTARAFPREYWNRTAFVAEPTGHLIGMFELEENGSGFRAVNRWNLMAARDAWVAPVQVKVGPDGALWVADFYTLVAQHNPTPQNLQGCCQTGPGQAYETPNRDRLHGRVYRIRYDSAGPQGPMRLDRATPAQLLRALGHDNLFWRMTAQRLLVERGKSDVVPALVSLAQRHTVDSLGLNPAALHALWTLHGLGALKTDGPALAAARGALHHPAASVRRAALQMLPRDARLLNDILAAGILPDRTSPTPVEYTVGSSALEDASSSVRLEALLVLSELEPSDRAAAAIANLIVTGADARDPWIPDAVAMAGVRQGPELLRRLMGGAAPAADSLALAGMARAVQHMARHFAARAEPAIMVPLVATVPGAAAALAIALLEGIAQGWPEETPPALTAEQRVALAAAARGVQGSLAEAFGRVAARWGLPEVFKTP
jgi:putative membrane-bound dehydrogenase-like protein